MYRSQSLGSPPARRGIILLVVLFMLTLFAIAGLSFVLYADAEATAARLHRDANTLAEVPDMDPELAFAYFLSQLIYDAPDNEQGVYSALRGHSLARLMYGLNYNVSTTGTFSYTGNTVPFVGAGRLHTDPAAGGQPGGPNNPYGVDDFNLPNYTYHRPDGFVRDPERIWAERRTGPTGPWTYTPYRTDIYDTNQRPGPYVGGLNAPYTYPDLTNMFLAHVRTVDGLTLLRSFHRDWTGFGPLDPTNPNWFSTSDPTMKYRVMRPRPVDQLLPGETWPPNRAHFGPPDDPGGDVKNLIAAPGGNDSIWLDIGAPVLTLPGGRKFKMLVAPLIIDLDGRLNLSVHGNMMGPNRTHVSHQGWGPWEVNLSRVLTGGNGNEWKNLFLGTQTNTPRVWGKYGPNQIPTNTTPVATTFTPHFYAQVDYNAARESAAAGDRLLLPPGGTSPLSPFPVFPTGRYGNGLDPTTAGLPERRSHARDYNVQRSATFTASNDDRVFDASNMAGLFRINDMGSETLTSELLRLCPDNFATGPNAERLRRLVTTHSFDMNVAGVMPYVYNVAGSPSYGMGPDPTRPPVGAALPYPDLAWRTAPPPGFTVTTPVNEFRANDWRGPLSDVARADLNRTLTRFATYTGRAAYNARFDVRDPTPWPPVPRPNPLPPNPDATFATIRNAFTSGRTSRHTFADVIYRRLLAVTGLPRVQTPFTPSDEDLAPRRWLAQLAVNIVDYIDEDNVSTAFNFYTEADAYFPGTRRQPRLDRTTNPPTPIPGDPPFDIGAVSLRDDNDPESADPELPRYWVFGTELPKVVVNEVLVEHRPPAEPAPGNTYNVNVWVELFNTMQTVPAGRGLSQPDGFPIRFKVDGLRDPLVSVAIPPLPPPSDPPPPGFQQFPAYYPYRVVVANRLLPRPSNDNVLGTPDLIRTQTNDQDRNRPLDFDRPVSRINGQPQPAGRVASPYIDAQGGPSGSPYFLIGPATVAENGTVTGVDDARNTIRAGNVPANTPYLRAPHMAYPVQIDENGQPVPNDGPTGATVLLRRLANPHLPPNNQRTVRSVSTIAGQPFERININPWYNPYVTVDHIEANPLNDSTNPDTTYAARGKRQPYASFLQRTDPTATTATPESPVVDQNPPPAPPVPSPVPPVPQPPVPQPPVQQPPVPAPVRTLHTFGQPNLPLPLAERFEWLVHLDRELISPMELIHVSGYPPHLLTQRFITGDDRDLVNKFQHYVPWFDEDIDPANRAMQSHRLYRLFEHLQCYDRTAGFSATTQRVPGKINLNAVWDAEVFHALCDAVPAGDTTNPNYFDAGHVQQVFGQLMARRSPNGVPGPNDRPFLSMAAGLSPPSRQHPTGLAGMEEGFLASFDGSGVGRRLFQPPIPPPTDPASHPYIQMQLLTKIFDQVSTRSNVFAVWATVGFFEVIDDTSRPVKLGAEIGRSEGRNIRHRMFAIIDRSNLTSAPTPDPQFTPTGNLTLVPYFSIIK